jgi:drug/metabolite transporter (DMT)-like permease
VAIKATSLDAWGVAGWRSAVATLVVLVAIPGARRGLAWRVAPVGLAYAATLVLFTVATKNTTAANAIFLQYLAPLWILLLGPSLLGESMRRSDAPFLGALAVGMSCIFFGAPAAQATAPRPLFGNLFGVGSGFTLALTLIGLRWLALRAPPRADPGASAVVVGNALAFAMCLPLLGDPRAVAPRDWLFLVYLGAVQIGLAYALLTRATPAVPALELSLLLLLEPVLNPVWTALVHGEEPGWLAVVGGLVVIGAVAIRTIRETPEGLSTA